MIIILIFLTVMTASFGMHLPNEFQGHAQTFHRHCLQLLPKSLEHQQSLEALVCGKNFENLELKHLFMQSSLIHIFVVSGTHFLLLHKLLAFVLRSRWVPFLPLGLYALATLCQPPGVRSFCFLVLIELTKHYKTFCSQVVLILLSALLSLAVFPMWMTSRSLLMSLMAALVIALMSDYWGRQQNTLAALFVTQSLIYFFMAFCLWGFSNLHPLGIVMNLVLGPLVGLVIFPLALGVVVMPALTPVFDSLMNALVLILRQTKEVLSAEPNASPLSMSFQWSLFLVLLVFAYCFLVHRKRSSIHEY